MKIIASASEPLGISYKQMDAHGSPLLIVGSRPPSRLGSRPTNVSSARHFLEGTRDLETLRTQPRSPCFAEFRNASYEAELFGGAKATKPEDYKSWNIISTSEKRKPITEGSNSSSSFPHPAQVNTVSQGKTFSCPQKPTENAFPYGNTFSKDSIQRHQNPQRPQKPTENAFPYGNTFSKDSIQRHQNPEPISNSQITAGINLNIPPSKNANKTAINSSSRAVGQSQLNTSTTSNLRCQQRKPFQHTPSYVDEMLFGPPPEGATFPAPWEKPSDRKPPLFVFDCTDYRNKPTRETGDAPDVRTFRVSQKPKPGSRPHSAAMIRHKAQTIVHKKAYVDETLFGEKSLEEADWPAPWEKDEDRKTRPLLYDGLNYKVTIRHNSSNAKPPTQGNKPSLSE